MCRSSEQPFERIRSAVRDLSSWMADQPSRDLGAVIIDGRRIIDQLEAVCAEATRRFEKSGAYADDGALGIIPWLKDKTRLSGGDAMAHVQVARQLEQLPRTEEALARGEIGFQHAVAMARTAESVGVTAVRKAEAVLLKSAEALDAGAFVGVVKDFEHRTDAEAALTESNRAYQRRYLSISEPVNGLARIEGQLIAEAAATIRSAMEPFLKPGKADDRTGGQRMHDALVDVCSRGNANGERDSRRPQLIIKASLDTLAGIPGAPPGELEFGGTIPAATVQRFACDAAITRITGLGELEQEITHAARTTPPSTRRALVARDGHCVFPGCDRPSSWCQSHHIKFWTQGGPTKVDNLALLCASHHRKVHEEGWRIEPADGRWRAMPPRKVASEPVLRN